MTLRKYQTPILVAITAFLVLSFPLFVFSAGIIESTIWDIVVGFFGLFVGLAGYVLDFAINDYVIGFGKAFTKSGVGVAVDMLWVAVRDIFNLTFIFGLVFIGLKMILGSDDSGTRKWLISLILAALLVNFSLFITKFIVDFSNIAATEIAQALPEDPDEPGTVKVSAAFMDNLGIQGLLDAKKTTSTIGWSLMFGTVILFIVLTFTFAAGGIMLLIRYVTLVLYMVFSPLMFLGWVFPQLQSVTSKYWSGFLGRAFFAPIYLLMIYFSYYVMVAMYGDNNANGLQPQFTEIFVDSNGQSIDASFSATIMPFIISCIFLIASVVVSNKLGAEGASTAIKVGNDLTNRTKKRAQRMAVSTGKGVAGAAGYVPQAGLRRGSYALGNTLNQQINKLQAKEGRLGKIARMNAVDDFARGGAGKMQNAKFGLKRTVAEEEAKKRQVNEGVTKRAAEAENLNRVRVAQAGYETNDAAAMSNAITPADREAAAKRRDQYNSEVSQRVGKLTDEQILGMTEADFQRLNRHMSDKQLSTYHNRFSDGPERVAQAKTDRGEATFDTYTTELENTTRTADELSNAFKGLETTIKSLSEERLKSLNHTQLTDPRVAQFLSDDQIKTLHTSGNFTATQISEIKTAKENAILKTITDGTVLDTGTITNATDPNFQKKQREKIFNRSVTDIGNLPVSVFTKEESFEYLTPGMLEARIKNGLSNDDKVKIRQALQSYELKNHASLGQNNPWVKWENSSSPWAAQFYS